MEVEQLSLVCVRRTRPDISQRTTNCGDEDARAAKLHGVEATGAHLLKTAKGGAAIVRVGARKKIKGWASPRQNAIKSAAHRSMEASRSNYGQTK